MGPNVAQRGQTRSEHFNCFDVCLSDQGVNPNLQVSLHMKHMSSISIQNLQAPTFLHSETNNVNIKALLKLLVCQSSAKSMHEQSHNENNENKCAAFDFET